MYAVRFLLKVSLCLLLWITRTCWASCGFRPDYDKRPSDNSSHTFHQSRIIGGRDALPGEWPWAVSLQVWDQPFCGASILNEWWILSAAHCFRGIFKSRHLRVKVGTTILSSHDEALEVQKIIIHPNYGNWYFDCDIALLMLSTPITFNVLKMPICLPAQGMLHNDEWHTCYVVGWGTLTVARPVAHKYLQKVEVDLIDYNRCDDWYWTLTTNMVCAGFEEGGRDSCQGDSGGPLVCKFWKDDFWYQVGLVSWGAGCAQRQRPGVYTRISAFIRWIINETTKAGKRYVPDEQRLKKEEEKKEEKKEEMDEEEEPQRALSYNSTASGNAALNPTSSSFPTSVSTTANPTSMSSTPSTYSTVRPNSSSSRRPYPFTNAQDYLNQNKNSTNTSTSTGMSNYPYRPPRYH